MEMGKTKQSKAKQREKKNMKIYVRLTLLTTLFDIGNVGLRWSKSKHIVK